MDYERRYNSALERAKYALTTDMDNSGHWACTYIFPELKKTSEKEIIQYLVEECESILANSDFTYLERTAKAENAIGWLKKMLSDDGVRHEDNDTDKSTPSKEEMVVNILKTLVSNWKHETKLLPKYTSDEGTIDAILEWLETRESRTKNFSLAEKEKEEFVCGHFLYCRKSLGEGLNEGEKYWLEYVGDDTYVGRSDNILNMQFHITPRQLYRCFTQQLPCDECGDGEGENNEPMAYGKYADSCLYLAAQRYYSTGEDAYSLRDVFNAGVRCGWKMKDETPKEGNRQKDYKNIPGSIIYVDSNGKLKATSKEEWNSSLGTPVAVVVIPASHMPDGKCRGMSLCNMSYKTPQTGTLGTGNGNAETNGTNLMWGAHGTDVNGLTNYDTVKTTVGTNGYGYFPSDLYKGIAQITIADDDTYDMTTQDSADDTEAAWWRTIDNGDMGSVDDDHLVISPYASDGSQNPAYITAGQALADMDGKANTEALVNLSAIKGTYSGGAFENIESNYPAAFACHLFSTVGTGQGDWYLPALGELGYLYTRIKRINESLEALGTSAVQFGDLTKDGSSLGYWCRSSSECDALYAWGFGDGGRMDGNSKGNDHGNTRVRAFAAFDI